MKIAICADLHARESDLLDFVAQWGALFDECEARGVETLMIAGDVFDAVRITDAIAAAVVGPLVGAIARARANDREFNAYAIPGNHDYRGPRPDGALQLLAEVGCEVVNVPSALNLWQTRETSVPRVAFLPWINVPDATATEILRDLCSEPLDLLVGHVQVIGARMSGAMTCPEGSGWRIARADLEALPVRRFALGDFHRRQDLTDGRGGYVGALRQLNHGEEDNPAGFEIWDSTTNEVEWVELDKAPRYRTVFARPSDSIREPNENERMRVRFEGQPDRALVRQLEAVGARVEIVLPREDRIARGGEIPPGALSDPLALLDLWAGDKGIGEEERGFLLSLAAEALAVAPKPAAPREPVAARLETVAASGGHDDFPF